MKATERKKHSQYLNDKGFVFRIYKFDNSLMTIIYKWVKGQILNRAVNTLSGMPTTHTRVPRSESQLCS